MVVGASPAPDPSLIDPSTATMHMHGAALHAFGLPISLGRSADVIRGEHAQPCAHENPGHLPLKLHLATCFVDPLSPSLTYLRSTILVLFASIATS